MCGICACSTGSGCPLKQAINNYAIPAVSSMAVPMAATRMCSSSGRKLQLTAETKRTLATVNALLGNVFLTSDMPSHYTDAQRDEYRRLRRFV